MASIIKSSSSDGTPRISFRPPPKTWGILFIRLYLTQMAETNPETSPILAQADAFLAYHGATPETLAYVERVVDEFEWFANLAVSRAVEALQTPALPDNVTLLHKI